MRDRYTELWFEPIVGFTVGFEFVSNDEMGEVEPGYYLVIDLLCIRLLIHSVG